jgi:hypothetical protein
MYSFAALEDNFAGREMLVGRDALGQQRMLLCCYAVKDTVTLIQHWIPS